MQRFPQTAAMPDLRIFPVGSIEDRINTDAEDIRSRQLRVRHFRCNVIYPGSTPAADMAGFRQQQRSLVSLVQFCKHFK